MTSLPHQLYGLCGFIGSGKNTAGDILVEESHGHAVSFAGPLKDAVSAIFGWNRDWVEGKEDDARRWRETEDPYWSAVFGRPMSPRIALQEMGTDVCRTWCEDVWVAAAGRRHVPPRTSVFTDTRFGNEVRWIRASGGTVLWVYRPELTGLDETDAALIRSSVHRYTRFTEPLVLQSALHASETAFLTEAAPLIHVVVPNTRTVADLALTVRHIHGVLARGDHNQLPWGQTTCYVEREWVNFRWKYRDPETNELMEHVFTEDAPRRAV